MVTREDRKDALLRAGLVLSSELSLPAVLQRIVEVAAELTAARYCALGVIGPERTLMEFVTTGVTPEERAAIGHPPEGHGILGVLIDEAKPLRLTEISEDARSVGFPPNHPQMHSFLGAPVKAMGRVYGNIYLTEKQGSVAFTPEDEEDLTVLATQAGVAVANAHLYAETRRRERWQEAAREITTGILNGEDTRRILKVVAQRARELVGAELATIAVPLDGGGHSLILEVADGPLAGDLAGTEFPVDGSISGEVIQTGQPIVLDDASADDRVYQPIVRRGKVGPAMLVPLVVRERAFGTLAIGNGLGGARFGDDDLGMVESFAAQASIALEYARARDELQRLAVMEDRERIAKELHDGVIQSLFAVGMGLQGTALMTGDEQLERRIEGAVGELDRVIRDLRNYIFGLRPGILADRQLDQALRELATDFQSKTQVVTVVDVDPDVAAELASRAGDMIQLTREALSNVGRHADASTCRVSLRRLGNQAVLEIDDDGTGFDVETAAGTGNGLGNLADRAASLGGRLDIQSTSGEGTTVRVVITT